MTGPMVRIGPKEVLIADPECLKVIYALRSGFTKVIPLSMALTSSHHSTLSSTIFSSQICSIRLTKVYIVGRDVMLVLHTPLNLSQKWNPL